MQRFLMMSPLLWLMATGMSGQQVGSVVQGKVSARGGGALPAVTITATNETTGATVQTTSDSNGRYRLELPAGRYTITAEFAGFAPTIVRGVTVKGARTIDVRISDGTTASAGEGGGQKGKPPPPPPPPFEGGGRGGSVPRAENLAGRLSWNVWADSYPGPTYRPLARLRPNQDYLIVLHLSGITYGDASVRVQPASADISGWADDWLKAGRVDATLQVLLLPDTNYFTIVDRPVEPLPIDLRAIREWTTASQGSHAAPLTEVAQMRDNGLRPSFLFGDVALRLHTTMRRGLGALALSIWSDAGRPLDEIALSFCVSNDETTPQPSECTGTTLVQPTLRGTDSLRVAAQGESAPDAALHFVELDNRGVIGFFRDNTCRECPYHVWRVEQNSAIFRDYLANTMLPAFGPTASTDSLADAGRGLYNLLFPNDDTDEERVKARAAFEAFVTPDLTAVPPRRPARSIFVRTIMTSSGSSQPLYPPLGLITIPGVPGEFLGFRFRVEAPLERQSYQAASSCISRWFLAVPKENPASQDALPQARQRIKAVIDQWGPRAEHVYDTIPELRQWLGQAKPTEASAALLLLSHHDQNTVFFDQTERMTSTQVERRFGEASMVVLDGCSTGAPMAVALLRKLNERGFATTIASQVAVRPELAGDFVATLGEVVDKGDAQGATIADVFFETLQELREKSPDTHSLPYGARALVFSLLGNGATRICAPQKEVR
jgi:hypothetical protein